MQNLEFLRDACHHVGGGADPVGVSYRLCESAVPVLADSAEVFLTEAEADEAERKARGPYRLAAVVASDSRAVSRRRGVQPGLSDASAEYLASTWWAESRPRLLDPRLLAVPLRARGEALGALLLTRSGEREPFGEDAMLLAGQLGAFAALSIQQAQVDRWHTTIAETLQQSLRTSPPSALPGVEIAHRYQPGDQRMPVGGDWFDVIPLSGGRTALVVGDVMGHGLRAAAIMAQLRTSVQTLAALELPPDQVLRSLDDIAQRLTDHSITTCVYAVYDPVLRRCTIASAGHLPPVLVHRDGTTELLKTAISTGLPIGLGRPPIESTEIAAEDGSLLALYTDGLVESRGQDIDQRLEALRGRVSAANGPLEEMSDTLLRAAAATDDDVTLLMARFQGIASDHVANWFLEPHSRTPGRVRQLVRRQLESWGLQRLIPTAELLSSELVTNACRYATRLIGVRLIWTDVVLFEVTDDDHRLPVLLSPTAADEGGRGLHIVSEMAERWGSSRVAGGKTVWFALKIPD
jgi:serine phosphatase RsbU (regulator of sigma subunit)